jgi:hypothetical protein
MTTVTGSAVSTKHSNPAYQLAGLAVLLAICWMGNNALRFTFGPLNVIADCACKVIPFFAIRPVLHLRPLLKTAGFILLTPLLLLSAFLLLGKGIFGGVSGMSELTQPLQTFQLGSSTIQLERYENGGAIGVHGLNLEQKRLVIPGLYIVKSIDFFDSAQEGTLSLEGRNRVRVHARGSYYSNDYLIDKVYTVKPWVYF